VRTRNWEGEPEIGRANLLVSRIMMFAIIDRKNGLLAGVFEKRLTGRFALPKKVPTSRFLTYSDFVGEFTPKPVESRR
jgi:hypothetical protein